RFLDETGKERWAPVVPPRFTIGRGSGNDLVFPHMNISRAQAEITVHEGEYLIRDLGSRHGTFVNGERIEQVKLNHGDRIELGGRAGAPSSTTWTSGTALNTTRRRGAWASGASLASLAATSPSAKQATCPVSGGWRPSECSTWTARISPRSFRTRKSTRWKRWL